MLVLLHRGADDFTHFMIPGEHQVISIRLLFFIVLFLFSTVMPRYIFLSLQVLVSINPQRGLHFSLTSTYWYVCSQQGCGL